MSSSPDIGKYIIEKKWTHFFKVQTKLNSTKRKRTNTGWELMNALKTCDMEKGKALHLDAARAGYHKNKYVATALITMYCRYGSLSDALSVFQKLEAPSVASWTSLILGYVESGQSQVAMDMFAAMDCQANPITFVAALKACAGLAAQTRWDNKFLLEKGIEFHRRAKQLGFQSDMFLCNTLVDLYGKCGSMKHARAVFNVMDQRTVVSWNSLISGYVDNEKGSLALDLFKTMDCEPDSITFAAALKACGSVAAVATGEELHARVRKLGLEKNSRIANSLVDFYGRCGNMSAAEEIFNRMDSHDTVSWNVLIAGYSSLGDAARVFALVKRMQETGVQADGITMVSILSACSHSGLVEEGRKHFDSMSGYGIRPTMEHYTCMVDMLGRENRLEEALAIANTMPFEGDGVLWTSLLGACKRWNNMEVGKVAFERLVACSDKDARAFVMLGDMVKRLGISA